MAPNVWLLVAYVYLQIFVCLSTRIICNNPGFKRKLIVPYYGIIILLGSLFGALCLVVPILLEVALSGHNLIIYLTRLTLFPVFVMRLLYSFDWLYFYKAFKQICILGLVVFFFKALYVGSLYTLVNDEYRTISETLTTGALLIPTAIDESLEDFNQLKSVRVLFKGEVLISMIFSVVLYDVKVSEEADFNEVIVLAAWFLLSTVLAISCAVFVSMLHRREMLDAHMYILLLISFAYVNYIIPETLSSFGIIPLTIFALMISPASNHVQENLAVPMAILLGTLDLLVRSAITWDAGVQLILTLQTLENRSQLVLKIALLYTYIYIFRYCLLFTVYPVLKMSGLGIDIPRLLLIGWGGLGHVVTLYFLYDEEDGFKTKNTIFSIGIVVLTQTINVSTLKCLMSNVGLLNPHKSSQMEECQKRLIIVKQNAMTYLKLHKMFANATWEKIEWLTAWHTVDNSKIASKEMETTEETEKIEMEAKILILKAQKMSYERQKIEGLLAPEAYHTLRAEIDAALLQKIPILSLKSLRKYWEITSYKRYFLDWLQKNEYGRWSNYVLHNTFRKFLLELISQILLIGSLVANLTLLLSPTMFIKCHTIVKEDYYSFFYFIFLLILLTSEFLAYRWVDECIFWPILDIFVMLLCLSYLLVSNLTSASVYWEVTLFAIQNIRLLRLFLWRDIIMRFPPSTYLIVYERLGGSLMLGYDIGKAFVAGQDDALKILPLFVTNQEVVHKLTKELEESREAVLCEITEIQETWPLFVAKLKTVQSSLFVLNELAHKVNELHYSGMLDEDETNDLLNHIDETKRKVPRGLNVSRAPALLSIIKNQDWLQGHYHIMEVILQTAMEKRMKKGEIIFSKGSIPDSIYFLHCGLVRSYYEPDATALNNLRDFGILPNVDHPISNKFDEPQTEILWTGSILGQIGVLTGRINLVTATCATPSMVISVPRIILQPLMQTVSMNLWKSVGLKIAKVVLAEQDHYAYAECTRYLFSRSIMPDLTNCKIFHSQKLAAFLILVEGIICDSEKKTFFYAPALIPPSITSVIIADEKVSKLDGSPTVRMLIIPNLQKDEIAVEYLEEGVGFLVIKQTRRKKISILTQLSQVSCSSR